MSAEETASAPRPAVLDMSPHEAAKLARIGAPCPVCGSTLGRLNMADSMHGGLLGYLGSHLLFNVILPSCRCGNCGFQITRGVPRAARSGILLVVFADWLLAREGWKLLENRPSPEQGATVLGAAAAVLVAAIWWFFFRLRIPTARNIEGARARWEQQKEEHDFTIDGPALLKASFAGADCPVCGKGQLEGAEPNPLWSRGSLRCTRCRLDVPLQPTVTGYALGIGIAVALVIAGGLLIVSARDFQGNPFLMRTMLGLAMAVGGAYLAILAVGSGEEPALKELERAKRRFERRKRGLSNRDDEEEPAVWFQENLEAVVVAVILALIIRHFVMEAFVIPTGSMAPTLLGDHFDVRCQNCGYPFAVAKTEGEMNPKGEEISARCPLCGTGSPQNDFQVTFRDVQGGNKILVNKFLFKIEPPERYNVIVFKYPRDPTRKNFIKRLVGLPGESIRVTPRGDVWVKKKDETEFHLAHKPRQVQEKLWMPAYDSRYPDPKTEAWKAEAEAARFTVSKEPKGEGLTIKSGDAPVWLDYQREIRDWYGYNKWQGSPKPVGDVRIKAWVTPDADARSIRLATVENGRALVAEIPVGTGSVATLTSNGTTEITRAKVQPLRPGVPVEVSLGYADCQAILTIDGKDVLVWDDAQPPGFTESSSVRLGSVGGARFTNVKVDRDVVYVPSRSGSFDPTQNDVVIPDDCYFCMGDNSPNSQDGREWGFVHEPHLIGRAFLVFWPYNHVDLIR